MLTGLLLLNKPADMRSTKCVELVRNRFGRKTKVGHGGTLDSTASGLLVVLIGAATRLSSFVMDMPKTYLVEASLGTETSTDDASGEIIRTGDRGSIGEREIDRILPSFYGWRLQEPPKVSAVHVDGRRAHELAREGQEVFIEKKPVFFASTSRIGGISQEGRVSFRIDCRKGTYIRSFVRDLGQALGCGAHVSELTRLSCGPFTLEGATAAEELEGICREDLAARLLPVESVCPAAPSYICGQEETDRLINGMDVSLNRLKRVNFSSYSDTAGNVTVRSDRIFSICRFKDHGRPYDLSPAVNIINDRSI